MNRETQQQKIIRLIKDNGRACSWELTYLYGIKQAPTRKNELEHLGYPIEPTKCIHGRNAVDYILLLGHTSPKKPSETQEEYIYVFEDNIARKVLKSEMKPEQSSFI